MKIYGIELYMLNQYELTSTVHSFIKAIFTVFRPIAEFVEVNALSCPDTLYVIEGTSDYYLHFT